MHYEGFVIGLICFVVIGVFHPIVIKGEYYFSKKIWPVFLVAGILGIVASFLFQYAIWSSLFSVLGFTCLWSIGELKEQEERVKKGWFPANPKKKSE